MPRPRTPRKTRHVTLTSLIDVVFLLLLFFMLSSTFTRHAEIPLAAAAAGPAGEPGVPPVFLRLGPEEILLNGQTVAAEELAEGIRAVPGGDAAPVLVSLLPGVTAQRLADMLSALAGFQVTVLG